MGYDQTTLTPQQVATAGGTATAFMASQPVDAFVLGLPEITFHLWPTFAATNPMVLWGRHDFFKAFGVFFNQDAQEFTLLRPDARDNQRALERREPRP